MANPWLNIPLGDYEGHMSLPSIGQAQMLAEQFERLMERYRPVSVAIVGCAGGNGLERIEPAQAARVVGIDINPRYLEAVRARHAKRFARLDLYCADVQSEALQFEPVDLVYAALLFEYVDVPATLAALRRHCRSGGTLATVLQLPSADQTAVSRSPYQSLSSLAPAIRLVEPLVFCRQAEAAEFTQEDSKAFTLPSGKQFAFLSFRA